LANYLVTGGAGFIGSHISEALVTRGHRVRVADNFVTGYKKNIRDGVEFVEGDCADPGFAKKIVAGMDYVVHQAAIPSVPRSVDKPLESHRANIDGMLQMLLASRDAGVKRLVFAGSSSVYGNSAVLPKREDMRPTPLTPYALQKLVSEQYCQMFTRLYGLETVTTRYFNVFGPRQQPGSPYSGVISLFIEALVDGRPPMIHGDGRQTRDFTYVGDIVDATRAAAQADTATGRVYNIGGGNRTSLRCALEVLAGLAGRPLDIRHHGRESGDVMDTGADTTRAERELGFSPRTSLADGLAAELEWVRGRDAPLPRAHALSAS